MSFLFRLTANLLTVGLCLCVSGCFVIKNTPKYTLTEGEFKASGIKVGVDSATRQVFVMHTDDTIRVYPITQQTGAKRALPDAILLLEPTRLSAGASRYSFTNTSFDVDFLTIPFKYRPTLLGVARQLNTTLNGAVYFGYRQDRYGVSYRRNLLGLYRRRFTHYGFSIGGFTGLGAAVINPTVTQNQVSIEYDGVVWSKGAAAILGIDNFTLGLATGWDTLLDEDRAVWLYNSKPWIGLVFGLNIN